VFGYAVEFFYFLFLKKKKIRKYKTGGHILDPVNHKNNL